MSNQILEKYDLAISYLKEEEDLAFKIYTELGEMFKVFIYSQHQKELVGKGGVETLRDIFINRANLIVILYTKGWGGTEWTSTEEKAIVDFGLKNQWKGIVLVNLDGSKVPDWFPRAEIYLDYGKYQFDELIGIIKLRAQERGSDIRSVTAVEKAKILQINRELAEKRKKFLNSPEGVNEAINEVKYLFEEIERICVEINSSPVRFDYKKKDDFTYYLKGFKHDDKLGDFGLEVIVQWVPQYGNTLDQSKLYVSKIDLGRIIYREDPRRIGDLLFDFDITPLMENRWRDNQSNKLLTSSKLADEIVKMIIDFKSA